jgi:lipoprotein-releasing system permease protein
MLSLAVMILSIAVMKGFKEEIRGKVRGFAGDVIVMKLDLNASQTNSMFSIGADTVAKLRKMKGISAVQPFTNKSGIIKANGAVEGVVLKGVDKSYDWTFFKKILVSGSVIDFSDSLHASRQILISQYTADRLRLKTGGDLLMYFVQEPLRVRKFTVAGIYNLGVEDVDKQFVIGDLSVVQKLNNWSRSGVGGYEIRISDFNRLNELAGQVSDQLGPMVRPMTITDYYPTIFQWLDMLDVNTEVILALMIAVAVINMISALLIIILERTPMIGILKALGNTNWQIRKIFLYNSAFLIGMGMVLGNILGIGLGYFQRLTHFFSLDQASYYISFVPVAFNWGDIFLLNLATLLVCLAAMILPTTLVTRIQVVKAISFR